MFELSGAGRAATPTTQGLRDALGALASVDGAGLDEAAIIDQLGALEALKGWARRRGCAGPSGQFFVFADRYERGMRTAPVELTAPWRHNGAMPSVQIKNVPDDTHAVLRRRAAAAHQSLQEYLRTRLITEASRPTLEEVLDRIELRTTGALSFETAADLLREDRARP